MNVSTPRPYNSYNIFFQIEREFVLQTLLGYQPTTTSNEVFNPTDETYPADGPSLPPRYEGLVLPYDWHIPGKGLRRKRSHRKSHGKIGFHELSDRISKSWSVVPDDVRNFCERLADIQRRTYKEARRKAVETGTDTKKIITKTIGKSDPKDDNWREKSSSFDWTYFSNFNQEASAIESRLLDDIKSIWPRDMCHIDTLNPDDTERNYASHRSSLAEVDMEDQEIIDLWKNTSVHSAVSLTSTGNQTNINTAHKSEKELHINKEYGRYKELGQQLLTRQSLPSKPKRRGFLACQA